VADIFEAMTADRPYGAAMPVEKALSILGEMRGVALCPAAVDAIGGATAGGVTWTADLVASEPDARVSPPVRRPA
jgi:hypothetical protein